MPSAQNPRRRTALILFDTFIEFMLRQIDNVLDELMEQIEQTDHQLLLCMKKLVDYMECDVSYTAAELVVKTEIEECIANLPDRCYVTTYLCCGLRGDQTNGEKFGAIGFTTKSISIRQLKNAGRKP